MNKSRGFTFLEVLAVVTLIGLLTAVTLPQLASALEKWKLQAIAEELKQDMRYAQQAALAQGDYCDVRFYIHTQPQHYRVVKNLEIVKVRDMPEGIRIEMVNFNSLSPGNVPTVRFRNKGTVAQGGTVLLKSDKDNYIRIIVTVNTGRIRIEEGLP
ncbi:prepilin-type N-terminal cleavage/methylation domain-containing protein [Desulfitispora alkaliphila]|uniref:GspH/FimT family pseudopilin n=1 Tax=Desulfitispora alkaliphila TaxID=622674 RepID=UPI003D23CE7A